MSTKNNPGEFNCYERAEPDEPMFVLLGRDPVASFVVQFWIELRLGNGNSLDDDQICDADHCAELMREWAEKLGKKERVDLARRTIQSEEGV